MHRLTYPLENAPLALLTDFYQMSMAYGYWKAGLEQKEAVFHLFFRKNPFGGGFSIAAGLEAAVHFIENFRFTEEDLSYLASLNLGSDPYFDPGFMDYLRGLRLTCDIDAMPEGSVAFPYEPILRVRGPIIQGQLLETPLLNLINFATLIATKASRICLAAEGDPVLEFGLRRAQGIDGGITASRAAYVGGCDATSNVLAGRMFGIPVRGTQAHSWVMLFDDEEESFERFADALGHSTTFLVDTYDTIEGVKKAIAVGKRLREQGRSFDGIRLDSGDLALLSIESRRLLDEAGFTETKIVASNALDEVLIHDLKRQGACIDIWGVGTNLVTAKAQPALDGVYKLSAVRDPGEPWSYKLKLSEQMIKISNPGILQVRRFFKEGECIGDAILDETSDVSSGVRAVDPIDPTKETRFDPHLQYQDILTPIFRNGKRVYDLPTLEQIRAFRVEELEHFPVSIKRFLYPQLYFVGMERSLYDMKVSLIKKIRAHKIPKH